MNNINNRKLEQIEINHIELQMNNLKANLRLEYIKFVFLLLSGLFALWVYYESTRPQTIESMNRERVKFMWEVSKEKDPENKAYGWKLIESVYKIEKNDKLEQINNETKADINDDLEIKKEQLRILIEKTADPVDKETYKLKLESLEKLNK